MKVICDTNIFIHFFNGELKTAEALQTIGRENILLPFVTKMELFRGMSKRQEMDAMVKKLKVYDTNLLLLKPSNCSGSSDSATT